MVDAMRDGAIDGMQTFDGELEKFIRDGSVVREVALAYASNSNNLALAISDLDGAPRPPQSATTNSTQVVIGGATNKNDVGLEIEGFER
jgi:Tfp pilus assembly ATPase PilU